MFAWIAENAATVIAVSVVAAIIGLAVLSLVKDKKHGSGGCTGNCASCGTGCPYCKNRGGKS
ncbi:MAG: FeoB-associated Cys-rich membrane protein [Clostridia bacterium]|nr:FeoB-associated Cys-rich membrane protein [Clostridia bacterium]